ncbi:rhamnogalacturonan acetylesterase [Alkalihalobacillus sp. 1P02AB]|uniref:rhamnogalacturonan acetylesterase n=1 Tax=Alkalihalobacillus sp. 1P02AB TaxID=3132260 RepID=UPI0039A5DF36
MKFTFKSIADQRQFSPLSVNACFKLTSGEHFLPGQYHDEQVPSFLISVPKGIYQLKAEVEPHTTVKLLTGQLALSPRKEAFIMTNDVYVEHDQFEIAWWGNGVASLELVPIKLSHRKMVLIGDSTMSEHPPGHYPQYGWGQLLAEQLRDYPTLNIAQSGRSSKSFREEGHFQRALQHLEADDLLLIQFGHNDQKTDQRGTTPEEFKLNLKQYVEEARNKGAVPVLLSPVQRRYFSEGGKILNPHQGYDEKVAELASEEEVDFIDLTKLSSEAYQRLGKEESKKWFMWLKPGEAPNYPEGNEDNTHFSENGARAISGIVISELQKQNLL